MGVYWRSILNGGTDYDEGMGSDDVHRDMKDSEYGGQQLHPDLSQDVASLFGRWFPSRMNGEQCTAPLGENECIWVASRAWLCAWHVERNDYSMVNAQVDCRHAQMCYRCRLGDRSIEGRTEKWHPVIDEGHGSNGMRWMVLGKTNLT